MATRAGAGAADVVGGDAAPPAGSSATHSSSPSSHSSATGARKSPEKTRVMKKLATAMGGSRRVVTRLDWQCLMKFWAGLSGVLYVLGGGLVLLGLVLSMCRLLMRRRNIRIGHRRGYSRYSL
jgi:hypothetical protein